MNDSQMFEKILNQELVYATGCTEPGAVSYCASIAATELRNAGDEVEKIDVLASKNILKNAMAAGLPKTKYVGVDYAAGIGALHGDPKNKLNVNNDIDEETYVKVHKMVTDKKITVDVSKEPNVLYIDITVSGKNHKSRAVIADSHTNVVLVTLDDEIKLKNDSKASNNGALSLEEIASFLTIKKIYDFCTSKEYDPINHPIEMIKKAEKINTIISEAGLKHNYGLAVGAEIKKDIEAGRREKSIINKAIMMATAGSDARMVGAPFAVVANSGSGNQGITITMPILSVAEDLKVSKEVKLRALSLAHLCSIRIKSKFGTLSAFCGATIAATGAACGITYLLGGDYNAIARTINNMMGTVAGMICDGAKPDCSLKIYASLEAAFDAAYLAMDNKRVNKTEGIVCEDVEDTINNVCDMSKSCSEILDNKILSYMLNKK
ncbi:MAG: L-serine ammonia-lyase, iron-sulfur-dependent, subunit alpha [Campylobacter sp.]|nr:L-serine ammonia-lyase, iron-sulfur-dependent, subunit alpha [Campylobacter sp.]